MRRYIFNLILLLLISSLAKAQTPSIAPSATVITTEGNSSVPEEGYEGSAPLSVHFSSNASNTQGWQIHYEWRFYIGDRNSKPYLVRYEENTDFVFSTTGRHEVLLYATFIQGTDTIAYTQDYWTDKDGILITVYESKLEMPNAFTPNGDGINDIYRAKNGYTSIISFKANIINRWGQVLCTWTDPAEGWDGTYAGKPVSEGIYYVIVKAKGADGRTFNIKKDVNLLRGYQSGTETH